MMQKIYVKPDLIKGNYKLKNFHKTDWISNFQ